MEPLNPSNLNSPRTHQNHTSESKSINTTKAPSSYLSPTRSGEEDQVIYTSHQKNLKCGEPSIEREGYGIGSLDISLFGTPIFGSWLKYPFLKRTQIQRYFPFSKSVRHSESQSYKKQISIDENKSSTN